MSAVLDTFRKSIQFTEKTSCVEIEFFKSLADQL